MSSLPVPVAILDLATIARGESPRMALTASVALAQHAEAHGYSRVWYAEHHNIPSIASAAPSVLISHIAANTQSIRLGAGGVMLPNHAPLTIAEQFGTLEALYPGRIDLGLGRAPGGDATTLRALRQGPLAADSFPQDVLELQGYLSGKSRVPNVQAIPGAGSNVPLYILGSSLFGARLAAQLGLPYGFASHFAPAALCEAVALYRREFKPSAQCERPHVMAGVNVVACDSPAEAATHAQVMARRRVAILLAGDPDLEDAKADLLLATPAGRQIKQMAHYSAIGTRAEVLDYLHSFTRHADADELIAVHALPTLEARLRSVELLS